MTRSGNAREEILAAATTLFARVGFDGASVRELTDAAGVTKPTLYYHFGNKEGVFQAAVKAQIQALHDMVERAICSSEPALERLREFAKDYMATAMADADGVRLLMRVQHATASTQAGLGLTEAYMHALKHLAALVHECQVCGDMRTSIDPVSAIVSLLGACNLNIQLSLSSDGQFQVSEESVFEHFLYGVKAP